MIRHLYSFLMHLLQPWLRCKLAWRARREPGYRHALLERFGYYTSTPSQGWVWVHAVSLGETRAAAVLVEHLRRRHPDLRLLLTHGTASGWAQGMTLLKDGDRQTWLPWDTPQAVQRFLRHFKPCIGVLLETEVWPNLVLSCQAMKLPLVLANARLSDKSLRRAQRLAWLARPAYRALTAVWAQTSEDAQRLAQLGAPVAGVLGNLKFDAQPDAAQLQQGQRWAQSWHKPVLMLASSRAGEELAFLQALKLHGTTDVQCLIVARHPQRFDELAQLIVQHGLTLSRRSSWTQEPQAADVWLGDTLGEMALYYGLSQVALLGGSFEPLGGQNLIEAAACACPVVMGPHIYNFALAAQLAQAAGAAQGASDMTQAVQLATALAHDPAAHLRAAQAGLKFAAQHQGTAQRTADAVMDLLK